MKSILATFSSINHQFMKGITMTAVIQKKTVLGIIEEEKALDKKQFVETVKKSLTGETKIQDRIQQLKEYNERKKFFAHIDALCPAHYKDLCGKEFAFCLETEHQAFYVAGTYAAVLGTCPRSENLTLECVNAETSQPTVMQLDAKMFVDYEKNWSCKGRRLTVKDEKDKGCLLSLTVKNPQTVTITHAGSKPFTAKINSIYDAILYTIFKPYTNPYTGKKSKIQDAIEKEGSEDPKVL